MSFQQQRDDLRSDVDKLICRSSAVVERIEAMLSYHEGRLIISHSQFSVGRIEGEIRLLYKGLAIRKLSVYDISQIMPDLVDMHETLKMASDVLMTDLKVSIEKALKVNISN